MGNHVTRQDRLYTLSFFQVLAGAMLTMIGVSMQFHFGEYVASIGYSVDVLGWITGFGFVGSLLLRPYAGTWIDRWGCRPGFLAAAGGAAVANIVFQFTDTLWIICLARILMSAANATFLTTVAVYAAQVAPPHRRAESLGTVGIGGFLGMMAGPAIGDAIFANPEPTAHTFHWFFSVVAATSLLAGLAVCNVRLPSPARHGPSPRVRTLLHRYWPGRVLLVCVAFAACLTIHMTFLERFAQARGFHDIHWFFFGYGTIAIALRVLCRQVPQRLGRRRVCSAGLFAMGVGILALIPVQEKWQLLFPALLIGAGHAFVFPSMVDLVAEAMPLEHRGVGTSVALGATDVGFFTGGIVWGQFIAWRGFEPAFVMVAVLTGGVALWFLYSGRPAPRGG